MKKLLIRLTGLMVTAAIVMSCSGIAFADETEGVDNSTGITTEEPAEIPDEEPDKAPAADESPAPAEEDPSKEDSQTPAEVADGKSAEGTDGKPAEDPANKPAEEPAEDPAEAEDPVKDDKAPAETTIETATIDVKSALDNEALAEGYINKVFGTSAK